MSNRKEVAMIDGDLGYTDTLNKMLKLVKIRKYGFDWVNLLREITG